jgi:NAD(P)-dependent dehydrogenase (short-subunit alcohol dehydrogenase family)
VSARPPAQRHARPLPGEKGTLSGRLALVTGGSRGVGAATVRALAEAGADVVVNCRNKAARAEAVAAEARALGARAWPVPADITDRAQVAAMVAHLDRIDVLVLNASGGMERDLTAARPNYPMAINRDAPLILVELARPRMSRGAVIVHVTSHLAHFYGRVDQIPEYEPVAASKRAGEDALLALVPALARDGIRLAIVSGDLIEDTIVPRLMERQRPGLIAARRAQAGALPTTRDMAEAIVRAAADGALPSGHVVYVGDPATVELRA